MKKSKKIFISTPMNGLTDKEIMYSITAAMDDIEKIFPDRGISFVHNYRGAEELDNPLYLLGRAILELSHCDAAYFNPGWENARGCQIEHLVCEKYGIDILEANLNG